MKELIELAKNYRETMISIRRQIHMNPEIDRDLVETANLVESYLKNNDIRYKRFKNNGIIAEIGINYNNIVALRADMDALEIVDLKDVPYKSTKHGLMHACGHDAHTAILLGAALCLKRVENKLGGTVRCIFQPAEETDGGAKDMIELGALEGVKAIFGLHVEETIKTGIIGVNRNVVSAASNPFKISIKGKGSHGAHPEDGIDSILIAAKVIDNLQSIVSREIAAVDNAVISIGKIHGGTAQNAICSEIVMEGILRTLGKNLREFCIKRMRDIVTLTAKMYSGEGTISFIESYPSFENDENLYKWFMEILDSVNCIKTIELQKPSMGVEDFAYYTEKVPGLYYKLGCRNEEKGITNPAHGSYFDIDEECLLYGCIIQSLSAFKFLERDISN